MTKGHRRSINMNLNQLIGRAKGGSLISEKFKSISPDNSGPIGGLT
jgi:hypothetical protein